MRAVFGMSPGAMGIWWNPHHGEDGLPLEVGIEVLDVGERVPVVLGDGIEAPVVPTGPPGSICLGNDVERGHPGRIRAPDDPQILHLLELCLGCRKLVSVKPPSPGMQGGSPGGDVVPDVVLDLGSELLDE